MTGNGSSWSDDGRGSRVQVFVPESAIIRNFSSDNGVNSENSMSQPGGLVGKGERASLMVEWFSASNSGLIAVIL